MTGSFAVTFLSVDNSFSFSVFDVALSPFRIEKHYFRLMLHGKSCIRGVSIIVNHECFFSAYSVQCHHFAALSLFVSLVSPYNINILLKTNKTTVFHNIHQKQWTQTMYRNCGKHLWYLVLYLLFYLACRPTLHLWVLQNMMNVHFNRFFLKVLLASEFWVQYVVSLLLFS